MKDGFFIVKGNGMGSSTVEHESYELAEGEAMRLAEKHPGTEFHVLGAMGAYYAEKPIAKRII